MASTSSSSTPSELDLVSRILLSSIEVVLDNNGAWNWDYRIVAAASSLVLFGIRVVLHKKGGVDWYSLIHAFVTGFGAAMCLYLNYMAAEKLTGTPEPLRSVQGNEPLTSLHTILPPITMGFSILDLVDGITLGWDFIMHGCATFLVMAAFLEVGKPQFVAPMLIIEVSTVFLNTMRVKGLPSWVNTSIVFAFFISFTIVRMMIFPYIWWDLVYTMLKESSASPETYAQHISTYLFSVIMVFGIFFNSLNIFWYYKLIKKLMRKIKGTEKLTEKNNYEDREARDGKNE